MLEILILLVLSGAFVYITYFMNNEKKDEDNKKRQYDFDLVFTVSIVLLATSFVFGILFSDRVIRFLMSVSKLASIGLFLHKIKSYFTGSSIQEPMSNEPKEVNMSGGGHIDMARHNDMYDDLPESDSEDDF